MPSLARSVPKPLKVPSLARSVSKPLKVPSLARSVPKPLKVPSLARSVPKPLKVPSLARSVSKPLKVPSLARSVPKPLLIELREARGHQPGRYEPLLIFASDLLKSSSHMNFINFHQKINEYFMINKRKVLPISKQK